MVLSFRPSPETQERVRELLERNAADELTDEEAAELERFGELEHLMQLVKARAQEYLNKKNMKKTQVSAALRREVRERAGERCEYCLLVESQAFFPHEPDHLLAEKHGGKAMS